MSDIQCGDKATFLGAAASFEGGAGNVPLQDPAGARHPILDVLPASSQSPVTPGLSSGENSPYTSQDGFEHLDEDARAPSALNADAKSTGIAKAPLAFPIGANAVVPFNPDDDDDDDDDDDWFSPKGPPSGPEHQVSRPPQKPLIKK